MGFWGKKKHFKRISVDALQPGMHISVAERWLDHPFLLNEFTLENEEQIRLIIGLGPMFSSLQAWVLEKLPGRLVTRDNLRSMQVPSVSSAPLPYAIVATSLDAVTPFYLGHAAPRERYDDFRPSHR